MLLLDLLLLVEGGEGRRAARRTRAANKRVACWVASERDCHLAVGVIRLSRNARQGVGLARPPAQQGRLLHQVEYLGLRGQGDPVLRPAKRLFRDRAGRWGPEGQVARLAQEASPAQEQALL